MTLSQRIEQITGQSVRSTRPLHGGMIGDVQRIELDDGTLIVAKIGNHPDAPLSIEGYMLHYLRQHSNLPVPTVIHSDDNLLLLEFIEGQSRFDAAAERDAARLLAGLHSIHADQFGLERDTLIASLPLPNPQMQSWIAFFRDHRLLYPARRALDRGRLPASLMHRIEAFAGVLPNLIDEPDAPALLHGDVWSTNVLARDGRVTAFLDPAIYYGHPEADLAYITLFNTFGNGFFDEYQNHRSLAPGFWKTRRDIYNLYPLLVHVYLFGGGYVHSVERIIARYDS